MEKQSKFPPLHCAWCVLRWAIDWWAFSQQDGMGHLMEQGRAMILSPWPFPSLTPRTLPPLIQQIRQSGLFPFAYYTTYYMWTREGSIRRCGHDLCGTSNYRRCEIIAISLKDSSKAGTHSLSVCELRSVRDQCQRLQRNGVSMTPLQVSIKIIHSSFKLLCGENTWFCSQCSWNTPQMIWSPRALLLQNEESCFGPIVLLIRQTVLWELSTITVP